MLSQLVLSQRQAEEVTRGLITCLAQASSPDALTACLEALNEHLIRYPSCKALMWQVCWKWKKRHDICTNSTNLFDLSEFLKMFLFTGENCSQIVEKATNLQRQSDASEHLKRNLGSNRLCGSSQRSWHQSALNWWWWHKVTVRK